MTSKDARLLRQEKRIKELEQMNCDLRRHMQFLKNLNDEQFNMLQATERKLKMYEDMKV